jgi:hypothetical protein
MSELVKMLALSRYTTEKDSAGKNVVKELAKDKPDTEIQVAEDNSNALFSVLAGKPTLKEFGTALTVSESYFKTPRKAHSYKVITSEKVDGKVITSEKVISKEKVLARIANQREWYSVFAPTAAAASTEESAE